jgi:NAD(P)-dependent dehydrogenase (short-subunit alcohol dehydrogenase family)
MAEMELNGKVALVTGASRGVGQAIATELARRGTDVVLAARTVDQAVEGMPGTLAETAAEVEALGQRAHMIRADLTETESMEALADAAVAWQGHVDVLVNNAAFLGRAAYFDLDETSLKNWTRQLTVNLTAPFLLAKLLVPSMRNSGGGVIANITSGAGLIGEYEVPGITYGTTKAALNRLSTLLSRDLRADGIAVFAVDPGYTRTVLVEQTAQTAGLDSSAAHDPSVPSGLVADLIEADIGISTGRIFKTVEGRGPVMVADSAAPVPDGVELSP